MLPAKGEHAVYEGHLGPLHESPEASNRERETERGRGADGHRSVFRRPSYFWSFRVLTVWNFHVATSENPAKRRAETDDTTSLLNCHTQCGQDTESQEGDAPPIDKDLHFCSPVFRFSSGWSTPATENRGGTGSLLDLEELDLEDEGRVGGDDGREATLAAVFRDMWSVYVSPCAVRGTKAH